MVNPIHKPATGTKTAPKQDFAQSSPEAENLQQTEVQPGQLALAIDQPTPKNLTPSIVQRLQQTHGNQFTQRLIQGGKHIQRCACGGSAGTDGECEACKQKRLGTQISAATDEPIQRFGSQEHVEIGNRAVSGQMVDIGGHVGQITYGEMIALAGDYFESVEQIRRLAADWMNYEQVLVALWKVNPAQRRRPPLASRTIDQAVETRYFELAARNETHFSTGSAPGRSNREQYIALHQDAISAAYQQGATGIIRNSTWEAREAFSNHFLTDAFSAGHIRTPRGEIKRHWQGLFPNFTDNLVRTISCYMASYINARDNVGWVQTVGGLTERIIPHVRALGGVALQSFAIGDLIPLLMHDADNAGLDVVSDSGLRSGGGAVHWRAVGDNHLYPTNPDAAATQTQQMVQAAVELSFREAEHAFRAGTAGHPPLADLIDPTRFSALPLLPRADAASTSNPTYDWRVSGVQALSENIKALIRATFSPGGEIRGKLDGMSPAETMEVSGFTLHTGEAWRCFKSQLLADPIAMIENICNGNTCPPGNNSPCAVGGTAVSQQPAAAGMDAGVH